MRGGMGMRDREAVSARARTGSPAIVGSGLASQYQ